MLYKIDKGILKRVGKEVFPLEDILGHTFESLSSPKQKYMLIKVGVEHYFLNIRSNEVFNIPLESMSDQCLDHDFTYLGKL